MTDLILQNQANLSRWNTAPKNFFETYFLLWKDISQNHVGWLRYTLYQSETQPSHAAVWATAIDCTDLTKTIAIKEVFPLDTVATSTDSFKLTIASSGLTNQAAWGKVVSQSDRLEWQLQIVDEGIILHHLPKVFYQWEYPPTKFISPFCGCKFSGHINVNDRVIQLEKVIGLESHFWGTEQVNSWSWSHCNTFKEDPDFIFDGVAPRSTIAGIPLPSVSFFSFFWEGQQYNCNRLISSVYLNKGHSDLNGWRFKAHHQDLRFVGEITSRPQEMLVYRTQDPNGAPRFTHLTFQADMSIRIERRCRSGWNLIRKLTAEKSVTFEVAKPEYDPQVQWCLNW